MKLEDAIKRIGKKKVDLTTSFTSHFDQMRCAMDWGDLKRAYVKNERVKLNFDDDNIVMKVQK